MLQFVRTNLPYKLVPINVLVEPIVFISVAVRWKEILPLIIKTASSGEVALLSFTGEEVQHMDTLHTPQYLVQMCVGVSSV